MKRSTQIGLAAVGVVLAAGVGSYVLSGHEPDIVSPEIDACAASGVHSRKECASAFQAAQAEFLKRKNATIIAPVPAKECKEGEVCEASAQQPSPQVSSAPSSATNSAGSSSNNSFLTNYLLLRMLEDDSRRRADSQNAARSAFSGTAGRNYEAPRTPRPVAPVTAPSSGYSKPMTAPSVESRGGFGSTARSFGMSSSS